MTAASQTAANTGQEEIAVRTEQKGCMYQTTKYLPGADVNVNCRMRLEPTFVRSAGELTGKGYRRGTDLDGAIPELSIVVSQGVSSFYRRPMVSAVFFSIPRTIFLEKHLSRMVGINVRI